MFHPLRTHRRRHAARACLVIAALLASTLVAATGQPAAAQVVTAPTTETARSLYMSNWDDTVGIWMASKLSQLDQNTQYGPRLAELRFGPDLATNQIVDYSGFFRDETNGASYTQINNFDASGYLDSGGVLRTDYRTYAGGSTPMQISRDYASVPNQDFMVVTYRLTNPTGSDLSYRLLDALHVNNLGKDSGVPVNASYDPAREAIVVDMSGSGQHYLVLGSYGQHDSYQVGDDTNSSLASSTVAPWYPFDDSGTLPSNPSVSTPDVSVGFADELTVPAGATRTSSFYLAVDDTMSGALAAAGVARGSTAAGWEAQTTADYAAWLAAGKQTSFADDGLNTAYDRALVTIKQSQNPVLGTWPATTNPIAYGYKTWARDSAMTAIVLDAAGHHAETDRYYRWLASVQRSGGTFATTFDNWTGAEVPFVEPEHDSIGMFLLGLWRHYQATGDQSFLNDLWPAAKLSADWIVDNIDQTNGFGAADASIWEEQIEYNAFTEALYVSGLWGAQHLASAKGSISDLDWWAGGPASILTSLQRSSLQWPAGMWNEPDSYYNRAVNADHTARTTVDASSDMLFLFGVLDPHSSRAAPHIARVEQDLGHDTWGIARYEGDVFYHTAPFSPAGDEVLAPEPSWPQMACYLAIYETAIGENADALARLTWYASRTAVGYMPPGEAVSNVTQLPAPSTMPEPVTGAWYVLASLIYEGQHDPMVLSPLSNAGSHTTITVDPGASGDWLEWEPVPYFLDPVGDNQSADPRTDIRDVAIANDGANLYLRVDNVAGNLPGFDTPPRFAVNLYSEDYAANPATTYTATGINGGALDRPMAYLVGRWSDSSSFSRFVASGGGWAFDSQISSVIEPQWDPATGRIELVVPRSALSSAPVGDGGWAKLDVALARQDPATGTWVDDDLIQIHYRLTGTGTPWLYGNVR